MRTWSNESACDSRVRLWRHLKVQQDRDRLLGNLAMATGTTTTGPPDKEKEPSFIEVGH